MATKEKKTLAPAVFKKGEVTIQGVNFNDAWARQLKAGKHAANPDDEKEYSAEELFIKEFPHAYPELADAEREALLKEAFAACLAAL